MTAVEHVCRESMDPRHAGHCACGRAMATSPSPRTVDYEDAFLNEAAKVAAQRFGIATDGFVLAVKRRLELGQERYGDRFFSLSQEQRAQENLEEAWDNGAYSVLDAQARLADGLDDSDAWHLFEIACHAAAIDYHARVLKHSG